MTDEQYRAINALLHTLIMFDVRHSKHVHKDFVLEEGPNWELCDNCGECDGDCICFYGMDYDDYYEER